MFGDVGLVTGLLDGPQGNGRDRVLRLWVKEGGQWRAVAFHGTSIGEERTKTAQPLLPGTQGERRLQAEKRHGPDHSGGARALETAVGKGGQKTYRMLTTPDFVRVTSAGLAHQREEWVSRLKGSCGLARQTNVRLRVFGDLALLTYLTRARYGVGPLGTPITTLGLAAAVERPPAPGNT